MDFYYQGVRCREQTALTDTEGNRKKVQKVLDKIETEITAGTFSYGSSSVRQFCQDGYITD
jgi:integrase